MVQVFPHEWDAKTDLICNSICFECTRMKDSYLYMTIAENKETCVFRRIALDNHQILSINFLFWLEESWTMLNQKELAEANRN